MVRAHFPLMRPIAPAHRSWQPGVCAVARVPSYNLCGMCAMADQEPPLNAIGLPGGTGMPGGTVI